MRVIVTGAGGFVGSVLSARLGAIVPDAQLIGIDVTPGSAVTIAGDLADPALLSAAVGEGVDLLIHLAAVPGGLAERDPALSRRINLDATLSLFDAAAAAAGGRGRPRVVYASTVAVLGDDLPDMVTDDTPPCPTMTYGAHKLMVEVALADLHRRERVEAISLRLPGIVARPPAPSGLKSAFLSDVFHAHVQRRAFTMPVSAQGRTWLMSVDRCVDNILHAAFADLSASPVTRAVTLPALHVRIGELMEALEARDPARAGAIAFRPDAALERTFAAHPRLTTPSAEALGFSRDADLDDLIDRVLARIAPAS